MDGSPRCDAHTHTTYSDGRNSILENARQAEAVGLDAVAITDHVHSAADWLPDYVAEVRAADAAVAPAVLAGCEAVILGPDGLLSLHERDAKELTLVLADLGHTTQGVAQDTPVSLDQLIQSVVDCYVNACARPMLDAIAHPFNLGRFQARLCPVDVPQAALEQVASAMVEHDVAFELMNQMAWWFPDLSVTEFSRQYFDLVQAFREAGVKFILGSDAHSAGAVGSLAWAERLLQAADIPRTQLVNLKALRPHRDRR
jgi:histidinol phosphatase-like PHP family hydrolase